MDREVLQHLNVDELRKLVRSQAWANGQSLQIQGLNKAGLIESMLEGRLISVNTAEPKNGNGSTPSTPTVDLAQVIADAIAGKVQSAPSVDEDQVRSIVQSILDQDREAQDKRLSEAVNAVKALMEGSSRPITVKRFDGTTKEVGRQHHLYQRCLDLAGNRIDFCLVGPAGSGKSTLAHSIAQGLGLGYEYMAFGPQTTKTDLLGYMDATGKYVQTALRRAYEFGGVLLLDELDAGNPGVLTALNGLLDNGLGAFPDGMINRHKNLVIIAAANTYGLGGDIQYVGRNQLDAATRERFDFVTMDYDYDLEASMTDNTKWLWRVRAIRKATSDLREKLVVSPRATKKGAQLLALGWAQDEVEDAVIFKGVNTEIKNRILVRANG